MKRALLLLPLCGAAGASTVTVEPGSGVTVKVTRNKTDAGKSIGVTVNKSDTVKIAAPGLPIEHTMHAGIDVAFTGWPVPSTDLRFAPFFTTGAPNPPLAIPGDEGAFRTVCDWVQMGHFDPIVYPGQPGAAHHHTFYGAGAISADTTAANIRTLGGGSSCRGGTANLSSYWHGSLIDTTTGKPLAPRALIVYYKTGWDSVMSPKQTPIEPLPVGLRMVFGNAGNTGPDPSSTSSFSCFANPLGNGFNREGTQGQTIPSCQPAEWLRWSISSRQCWNGQFDSADHRSHLTDPVRVPGTDPGYDPYRPMLCPASHSHLLPIITYIAQWELPAGTDYSKLRLASDVYAGPAGYSAHADYFMGWDPTISNALWANCHRVHRDCGSFTLGDGRAAGEWGRN